MPFLKYNFVSSIQKSLLENEYIKPTPIQEKVIPLILESKDVVVKSQTGSGKTASFVLPLLNLWLKQTHSKKAKIKTLVLTPTRELALQVAQIFLTFSKNFDKKPRIVSVIGGEAIGEQLFDIQKGCDVVVATPGRLLDIINKKQINLSFLEFFVLDEADKMLDLGFSEELDSILEILPQKRQNLFFSATYPNKMLNLVSRITSNPIEISIENEKPVVETIIQRSIEVNQENRAPLLRYFLRKNNWEQVLVFMANNRAADNIAAKFRKHGFKAESFHGNLEQNERIDTLNDFKSKKTKILFASDIAARGLDIKNIACVVNYDLPRSPADYIHRIGRTGRAGKSGIAISFVTHENAEHFKLIEKRSKIKLVREQIEGFKLAGEVEPKINKAPIKGKRKSKKDKLREEALKQNK